jgi:uncharacterized protein (TIGR02284 family)
MNNNINSSLEDLVQYLQDSRNGYSECADNVDSPLMKNLFKTLSDKRQKMLNELRNICENKDIFDHDGTLKGKVHQIFVNLKGLITGKDVESIVKEIERGENVLIDNYKKTLENDLPFNLSTILRNQMQEVERDLSDVCKRNVELL